MDNHNYIFIMAGGVGSRFWPQSRQACPKQFIDIMGVGKSLLQLTYERFLKIAPEKNIYIVTNNEYKDLILEHLPNIDTANILCEPSRNNTAPCIAYAAFKMMKLDPSARMVVAPSDHFILNEQQFVRDIKESLEVVAQRDILLTLGITPTRPDTGYGYINYEYTPGSKICKVLRFTEKPVHETAVAFLEEGNYVWNAGIFIWNVSTILQAFKTYAKDVYDIFNEGLPYYNTPEEQQFINTHYGNSPKISIDYAIMEKADNVSTMPVDFGWSDLGTWASLYHVLEKKDNNNVISEGEHQLMETADCIIRLPKDKMAVIRGLSDYIVVDTENVLLIYPKSLEQEIKKIAEQLKDNQQHAYL
ncbi:mannose-1-phosphate guanylyltransferase [Chitinophaga silvisoli]|uniref:mannose-1-phosphate guanylyltransferase n=2 Tax=Chitinophaga silvisoli TaxID=2291814 RepID=A0A3E1P6T5_9BACT|nr:mannose-1-phosphate guanylyltransferase [Chitinophaga silvisoli]